MPHLLFPPHGKAAKAERLRRMPQLCQNRSHLTAVFGGVIEYVAQHVFHLQLIVRAFDVAVLKRLIKPAIRQRAQEIPPCLPKGIPRRPKFCERGKIRSSRQYRRVGSLQSLKPHPFSAVTVSCQAMKRLPEKGAFREILLLRERLQTGKDPPPSPLVVFKKPAYRLNGHLTHPFKAWLRVPLRYSFSAL